jgi:phosphoribosylformylglycinamidine (FGAM) synthase PurS component
MQMFTSTRDKHQDKRYCADCADTNQEVRAELAAAHATRDLDITDDQREIEGQTCQACQRLISQVPAHLGTYRLQVQVTFIVEVDLQARSATDAEYQLDEAVDRADFNSVMEDIKTEVETWIEDPEKVDVNDCQYHVEPASRVAPEQNVFVSPSQERMIEGIRGTLL